MESGSPSTLITLADASQCVDLIEGLHSLFKQTFKRKPTVALSMSVTFGSGRPSPKRRKRGVTSDWTTGPVTQDTYSVVARMGDPASADQQWEVQWFKGQVEEVAASISATPVAR